jgi:hypothetical protein
MFYFCSDAIQNNSGTDIFPSRSADMLSFFSDQLSYPENEPRINGKNEHTYHFMGQ